MRLSSYVGFSANLVVVLSVYEPAVSCFGQRHVRPATQYLQDILSMAPVGTKRQTFGPEGEPGVEVVVPITYNAPMITCESNFALTSFAAFLDSPIRARR